MVTANSQVVFPGWWSGVLRSLLGIIWVGIGVVASSLYGSSPVFNREIRPLLSNACFPCHGPDSEARRGGLRLDTYAGATAERDGLPAIDPGNSAGSELIHRIASHDADERMPPPEFGSQLKASEIMTLRRWIDAGASYSPHWAFVSPVRPEVPGGVSAKGARNPIDRFVQDQWQSHGLIGAPEADRRTLIRRVTQDLTGLPPQVDEVEAFVGDRRPGAYERVVDRLLASVHFGERMALAWMDVARYADTSGLNADGARAMWPWRDWVIRAYNSNLPFDRFLTEQLAGDLLEHPTRDQRVATGFNRNNATSDENGAIPEELRVGYVVDRVKTTMNAFQALSVECAQCHDHKYDPISQLDYYRLFAFFNNTTDPGMQTRRGNQAPVVWLPEGEAKDALDRLAERRSRLIAQHEARHASETEISGCVEEVKQARRDVIGGGDWMTGGVFAGGTFPDVYNNEQIDIGTGQPEWDGVGPEYEWVVRSDWVDGEVNRLWMHRYAVTYFYRRLDAGQALETELTLKGGDGTKVWLNGASLLKGTGKPTKEFRVVLPLREGTNHLLIKVASRVSQVLKIHFGFSGLVVPSSVLDALDRGPDRDEDRRTVARYYRTRIWPEALAHRSALVALDERVDRWRSQSATSMVMEERQPRRPTYVLDRGRYDAPQRERRVAPGVPSVLPSWSAGAPRNRLGLAQWMVRPDHPLTARVAVNRWWTLLFGRGLVDTPMDFGNQGAQPSHPRLLDWLAVELISSGWDVKRMLRLMVTSSTYRQSSRMDDAQRSRDPENRLLARGARFRLSAELIRDHCLSVSGMLVDQVGGPSIKPYQPEGLWAEVSDGGDLKYEPDTSEALFRRGMYVYWKRAAPHPAMLSLDQPVREQCQVQRNRTNTPLQALVLLNDTQFVELARQLSARLLKEADGFGARLSLGFQLCVARKPSPEEVAVCRRVLDQQLQAFKKEPKRARQFVGLGESDSPKGLDPVEHAAWTILASLILNLDETMTRG